MSQDIAREGGWLYNALVTNYLEAFSPQGLLGKGMWPGAAQKDFQQFFDTRFCACISESIVMHLFPHLKRLEQVRCAADA